MKGKIKMQKNNIRVINQLSKKTLPMLCVNCKMLSHFISLFTCRQLYTSAFYIYPQQTGNKH